ncbi:MAG: ATP-binding protein [Deltaproteobacteria bacterium]|nr:ATP-binding protein [Deltaproteobacteria bacterium]
MNLTRSFTSLEQLPELLDLVDENAKNAGLPDSLVFRAQVVLEELFVNIFKHAYQGGEGRAEVTLDAAADGLFLRLEDWGPPFNPLTANLPDLQNRFELGIPGGAGLLLVRNMGENPRYSREDGRNILEVLVSVNE